MPINLRALSITLALSGIICIPAFADPQSERDTEILLSGAKNWVAKKKPELAQELLKKLLLIDPKSPDALLMLGKIELKNGNSDEARRYLKRLQQAAPDSPQTLELADTIHPGGSKSASVGTGSPAGLESQSNDKKQLASTLSGFEEMAKRPDADTQRLQKDWRRSLNKYPDNADKPGAIKRYLAVYPNDAEMIALLGNVQRNKEAKGTGEKRTGKFAKHTSKATRVAAKQPAEKPVEDSVSLANDPDIIARTDALDALSDGNLDVAETSLLDIIKRRPQDPEVIGGLGLVKQKQGKFAEAQTWFEQALAAAQAEKSETGRWESLISTSKFSQYMKAAEDFLDKNQLADAEAAVQQGMALKPDYPDAMALMGNIKAAGNDPVEAERLYREALKIEDYNTSAIRGLSSLLSKTGRSDEALALIEHTLQANQIEWNKSPYSQASLLREEANLYLASHRTSRAIQALETAVLVDPKNEWVRFSLAKLYISLDMASLGRRVMDEGVALAPNDATMHYVRALVLISLDDYAGGLDSLARIPDTELTQDMLDLRNRVLIKYYFQQAEAQLAKGNRKEAIRIMSVAETQARGNYSATEQVAESWFQLDLQKQGLNAMRQLPQPVPLQTQIKFASLLNRAKQDQELTDYLPSLQIPEGSDETNTKYRETIRDIEFSMAGRQFEKLKKAGKTEEAQQFADTMLDANKLSSADYFKFHRSYFYSAQLPESAIPQLNQEKEQNPNDLGIRWDLANAYAQEKQNSNAQRELQELLTITKGDDIDMRLRVAKLQEEVGDSKGARQTIDDLTSRFPNNTDILFQAGNIARAEGNYDRAMNYYRQTQTRQAAPVSGVTAITEQSVKPDITLNLLPAVPLQTGSSARRGSAAPAIVSTSQSDSIYRSALAGDTGKNAGKYVASGAMTAAEQAMASLNERRTAQVEIGLDIQSKSATSGTSTYNATEVPLVARFPIGYEAHGTVQVDRVNVDAGTLSSNFSDAAMFGKIQASQFVPAQPLTPPTAGTSVGLGYEQESFKADIGMVGIGFPVSNIVGGIRHGGSFGKLSYSLNLSRRPYTGSQVSYTGAKDPVTGAVWGGVTNTGVSLYMTTTLSTSAIGDMNITGIANYGLLRGQNVLNNDRLYLRAVIDKDIYATEDTVLNLGFSLSYMSFSQNQGYYTFGQGGYYSPKSSLSFGLPVELKGRADLLSYQIKASLSYATTQSDAAPFYPTDPALQASAALGQLPSGYTRPWYEASNGSGYGYGFLGAAQYRATPNIELGGRFSMDRSAYYAPNAAFFYLRYLFQPETGPVRMTPNPVVPYSQY